MALTCASSSQSYFIEKSPSVNKALLRVAGSDWEWGDVWGDVLVLANREPRDMEGEEVEIFEAVHGSVVFVGVAKFSNWVVEASRLSIASIDTLVAEAGSVAESVAN